MPMSPGPWTYQFSPISELWLVLDANDEVVVRCPSEELARAIAALPKLVDACKVVQIDPYEGRDVVGAILAEIEREPTT